LTEAERLMNEIVALLNKSNANPGIIALYERRIGCIAELLRQIKPTKVRVRK
jgi:hypothetical protein